MKKLPLLILLNVAFAVNLWAQLTQIPGTTKFDTKVTYGNESTTDIIPGGYDVDILGANNYFFIINYLDGKGYVNRKHINYDSDQLNELLKANTKKDLVNVKGDSMDSYKFDDKYKIEIDYIRYCAGKYSRKMSAGYFFTLVGVAAVATPSYIDFATPDIEKTVKQVGYGMGVLGVLLILDSNKWMKRIYVGPQGFGIRYPF